MLVFAVAAFVGCAQQQDFTKLEKGTASEEIIKEYGEPDDKVELIMGMEMWRYSDNVIALMNGKVLEVKADTDSAEIIMDEARKGMEDVQTAIEEMEKELGGSLETLEDLEEGSDSEE